MNDRNIIIFRILLLLLFSATTAFSQHGVLMGTLVDSETNEPIFGATVSIEETAMGGVTDFDGRFRLNNVPEGTYQITSSYLSYKPSTKKDVHVRAGDTLQLTIALHPEAYSLETVSIRSEEHTSELQSRGHL